MAETAQALKIAIDGPAGAGKSTVAKLAAKKLGYLYLDTGAMYRAATVLALRKGLSMEEPDEIAEAVAQAKIDLVPATSADGSPLLKVFLDDEDITFEIRSREVSLMVSPLSTIGPVRDSLVAQQRRLAQNGGVVLDGRDIGTVVLPTAEVKIFLTASAAERAKRRMKDFDSRGENVSFDTVLKEIVERDKRDSTREIAPLKKAADAHEVVTDGMTISEVVEKILEFCSHAKAHEHSRRELM
jgi:cytidylate kinase